MRLWNLNTSTKKQRLEKSRKKARGKVLLSTKKSTWRRLFLFTLRRFLILFALEAFLLLHLSIRFFIQVIRFLFISLFISPSRFFLRGVEWIYITPFTLNGKALKLHLIRWFLCHLNDLMFCLFFFVFYLKFVDFRTFSDVHSIYFKFEIPTFNPLFRNYP